MQGRRRPLNFWPLGLTPAMLLLACLIGGAASAYAIFGEAGTGLASTIDSLDSSMAEDASGEPAVAPSEALARPSQRCQSVTVAGASAASPKLPCYPRQNPRAPPTR